MTAPGNLSLAETLDCGQSFRWEETNGVFEGVAGGRFLQVTQETLPQALEDPFWLHYFDAQRDYQAICAELSALHPVLGEAASFAGGIRILNQNPWEALCSFLISQNNNIPRIKGIIRRLCEAFGQPLPGGRFAFPTPQALCALSPEELAPLHCGYRARYLIDAARRVATGALPLEALRTLPLSEAREELLTVLGVGVKVADCVLLFGLHRLDSFPMDVWMKRAMETLFPGMTPGDFGPHAGIAQQYIFHFSRCHPELFR